MKHCFAGLASCTARHAVLIAIAITLPAGASLAQGTRAQRIACTGDVWRLCSSAIPSVGRIVACLKRERARLSPGCQAVFNDPKIQAAVNRPAAPSEPTPHAQPERAAATTATRSLAGAGRRAAERSNIATRSLPAAPPEEVSPTAPPAAPSQEVSPTAPPAAPPREVSSTAPPAAPPEEVSSAAPPVQSGAGLKMPAPTERVASRDFDSMRRDSSRHGRQQREAFRQSSRRERSGNRYGGIMARVAPFIAMATGGGQYGGRGNFDMAQIMGMARNMGFDPGSFMDRGGY
jgi:hypothetical protein